VLVPEQKPCVAPYTIRTANTSDALSCLSRRQYRRHAPTPPTGAASGGALKELLSKNTMALRGFKSNKWKAINEATEEDMRRVPIVVEDPYIELVKVLKSITTWAGTPREAKLVHMDFILDRPIEIAHFQFPATPAFNRIKFYSHFASEAKWALEGTPPR
jgi:hypothetical protein